MTDIIKLPTGNPPGNTHGSSVDSFWPTLSARSIRGAIELCSDGHQLGLITGPSGIGKTTAARRAVQELHGREIENEEYIYSWTATYLAMTRASDSLQTGLFRIARAIGCGGTPHMGANDLLDLIVDRWDGRNGVLVLDEAQFVTDALLHAIRNLWDELDERGRAPAIVLVGTPELSDRVLGRSSRKTREFDALRGRLGMTLTLDRPDAEDFEAICAHLGLSGAQACSIVQHFGRDAGGLHNVRRLLANAGRAADRDGRIGLSDLKRAAAAMGVSI